MSQAYDFNTFQAPQAANDTWFNNEFISNQQNEQQQLDGFNKVTPSGTRNDVDGLIDGDLFMNNTQQFNDFIGNTASAGSNLTSSSDKSSPSTVLNNVPFTSNDINFLNNEIQKDEKDLSEKELADRRKAQNRAAQRAFRERKEMKLKELEEKLNKSEYDKSTLLKQLEDLRKQNVVISTENKLLLQNGNTIVPLSNSNNNESFSFPSSDYHQNHVSVKRETDVILPTADTKNLTITQVWEYLNEKNDPSLDLESIMNEIKGLEVCHEQGPAYPKRVVDELVAQYSTRG